LADLEELMRKWRKVPRAAPYIVGAVRARSEILDRVLDRGQEMGIVVRVPRRRELLVAGAGVGQLSTHQLRGVVVEQLEALQRLAARIGDLAELKMAKPAEITLVEERDPEELTAAERARRQELQRQDPAYRIQLDSPRT
jgi:hypothetical protein